MGVLTAGSAVAAAVGVTVGPGKTKTLADRVGGDGAGVGGAEQLYRAVRQTERTRRRSERTYSSA